MTDPTTYYNTINYCKNLSIIRLKVNGLFDDNKRQQISQYLDNKKAELILLQETHSHPEITK